ncbi:BppU family phage baseplate upper protein [Lactobacillus mulieris]|uniref:BppU family phage baseplate upper protein n=1 Tax=Lactobacillus mulieris TaxID=2508708 RepID=UPI00224411EB|nr:BppU family phage baseplate upper protein [Lactobacillus mulieris]MCW8105466.1 BppU family phage baseplate upper protein [Lactobacillus mulieris]MDK7348114.1 BppU family phage baseplate upper protein [Lactobacillus mulieris]
MAEQKITLPMLELDLQKITTFVSRPFRLTQGDKGYIQPFHLSVGFAPYSATADTLCFAGTKPDGQIIEVEAEPSRFSKDGDTWFFSLPDEVAQAIGTFEAYFYVKKGNSVVASTTKFAYEVGAKFGDDEASNSYVSVFNSLRDKFSQIIESSRTELNNWTSLNNQARADLDKLLKDLKTQTDNWLKAKTSEVEALIAKYNSKYNELVGQWNNQVTTQQSKWQSQLNQQQSDFNSQKARIDSEYRQQLENLKSQLNSEWQQQKQAQQASFDSFKTDLTNRISQAKSDIDGIQAKIPEMQTKLDTINSKIQAVDFSSFVTKSDLEKLVGNLITADMNQWTMNSVLKSTPTKISFENGVNLWTYQGTGGTEVIYTSVTLVPYVHYNLKFDFIPKSDIKDLSNGYSGTIGFAVTRNVPALSGKWTGTQGTGDTTTQIKQIAINKSSEYEIPFYSDTASILYIGFNFNDIRDLTTYKFSFSNIELYSVENDLNGLNAKVNISESLFKGAVNNDSSWQNIFGSNWNNPNKGHLISFSNRTSDRLINTIGNWSTGIGFGGWDVKGLLSVNPFDHQARIAGGNGDSPTWREDIAWKSDFANYYTKSETDAKFANTGNVKKVQNVVPDGSGNVNLTKKVAFAFDVNSGGATDLRDTGVTGYWGVDQNAIVKILRDGLPAKYAAKSETDSKIQTLQNRCEALETQLTVLKGQMSNLLSVINVSDGSLNVSGNLIVKHGNIQNYWGGVDQYVAYSPSGVKRGYFGVWDNGTFQAQGN